MIKKYAPILLLSFSLFAGETNVKRKGFKVPEREHRVGEVAFAPQRVRTPLPDHYDMRGLGLLTPIKDQGNCGSCWAFGATNVLETMAAKKFGVLVNLSEQQIVSCATQKGVAGCNGGNSIGAWAYTQQKSQVTSKSYPYVSGLNDHSGKCKETEGKDRMVAATAGYKVIRNEDDIRAALVEIGPVAIAIATDPCFLNYKSGVLKPENCACNGPVDHLVTVVGYASEGGEDYWVIRNSWGESWGEKGYARFKRGVNQCQMMAFATIPGGVVPTKHYPKKR